MTNLVLMIAHKLDHDSDVNSKYDSVLFKPHMGSIYKSQFAYYTTAGVYVEKTDKYILMAKKDGYLYTWKKRSKNNDN